MSGQIDGYISISEFTKNKEMSAIDTFSFFGYVSGLRLCNKKMSMYNDKGELIDHKKSTIYKESDLENLLKMKMNIDVKVGQIWVVITDKFKGVNNEKRNKRKVEVVYSLKKGEHIEIRYPFKWHYRTEDDIYLHSTDEDVKKNCILLGDIDEKVRFGNKAKLEEILRLELYTKK